MPQPSDADERGQKSVIEGPSATTDPDNANSGPGAYLLFALAIALLVALYLGLASCVDSLGAIAANTYRDDYTTQQWEYEEQLDQDWPDQETYDGDSLDEPDFTEIDEEPLTRA